MKTKTLLALTTALTFAVATPAAADPISGAIALFSGAASWIAGSATATFFLKTAISFGLSTLAGQLTSKAGQQNQRGIPTETTTAGGTAPQTVILGRYATGGHLETPMMTHGANNDDQDYLTYVISVSDHRISGIDYVYINGERCAFVAQLGNQNGYYGVTANASKFTDRAWLRWHDGTQTEADATLLETYAAYERPWTVDHIMTGVAYTVMTFKYDEDYKSYPEVKFEVRGAPLYDPRKDSSVGGDGTQRWSDPETWAWTENPVIMVYNILRGLTLADGSIYGLDVGADDLPLDRWAAAMNTCDELLDGGGRFEPRYACGMEFSLDAEPLSVIDDILKSCGGEVAECGGIWNIDVGPAPFARAHIVDESLIVSDPRDLTPFRGLADTYNSIHGSHPDKDANWVARDAPPFYLDEWIAEDDGRRLVAELALPTVTQYGQVQRLMQELIFDNRLMITHAITLPPTALGLLPLDTLTWTSARNGYEDKLFQVVSKAIDPHTLNVKVALRERSPDDYGYEYVDRDDAFEDPALPIDGAPDPDINPPESDYTDPETGEPVDPVRPDGVLADVVALHDGAVSRSSDGGAHWLRKPATFGIADQISALDGQGFLVRTAGSQIVYSAALQRWSTLTLTGFNTQVLPLVNPEFEFGDLSGWSVDAGAPIVLDTPQPPQQGGAYYLTGDDFRISQSLSIPAGGDTITISADTYSGGSTGTLTAYVSETLPQLTGNQTWNGLTIENYATAPGGAQLDMVIVSGTGAGIKTSGNGTNVIELQYTNGTAYEGPWIYAFYKMNTYGDIYVKIADYITLLKPPGSSVNMSTFSPSGTYDVSAGTYASSGDNGAIVLRPGSATLKFETLGSTIGAGPNGDAAFYNTYTMARVELGTASNDAGYWNTISISGTFAANDKLEIELHGAGSNVYFDNVRAEIISQGDLTVRCIARDLFTRRHLAATDTGIHAVIDGAATQLCETPFSADFMAAHGDVLVIASGNDIALSEDNGLTWTQHAATGIVAGLMAKPQPVAVTSSGKVLSVLAAGLSEMSDLGSAHEVVWEARRQRWLAVSGDGVVQSSLDLINWTQQPDMPVSITAGDRRILPLDIGRILGRAENSKDMFWSDGTWSVAPSLTSRIRDLQEVK